MENIIEITNVRKIYRTYQKKSGLKNMIKNIIYPDFKDFIAVDDVKKLRLENRIKQEIHITLCYY